MSSLDALLEELLPFRGDEHVLEVGGTGAFASAVAPRVAEVVRVELGERLAVESFSFDVSATLQTLHHTPRPELVVAELARVTKPGGTILVVDQLAPVDPLEAIELNRFEKTRDATTTRVLSDGDLRSLFDSNELHLRREQVTREPPARMVEPTGYEAVVGWYVLTR